MLQELIDKRNNLISIAIELYGSRFIFNEEYWMSNIEQEINEVETSLTNLGWVDEITPEEEEYNNLIYKSLLENTINAS